MSQEKYTQHYIEIMTATMTDCIIRNVSLQANSKMKEEIVDQLNQKIMEFKAANDELSNAMREMRAKTEQIDNQNQQYVKLKNDYEILKSNLSSSDIFRKELIKEREQNQVLKNYYENKIKELNEEIQVLKAPPKRKKSTKTSETATVVESEVESLVVENFVESTEKNTEVTKDGGIF